MINEQKHTCLLQSPLNCIEFINIIHDNIFVYFKDTKEDSAYMCVLRGLWWLVLFYTPYP